MNVAFAFTTSGLKHIDFDKYEKDFTFYVGNQMFKCNKFMADFISPKISEMRNCDTTINSFYIPSSKCKNPELFKLILSLSKGYSILISQKDLKPLSLLFKELGNNEFLNFYLATIGAVDNKNVVTTVLLKSEYNLPIETEFAYLASHFYKIDKSQLDLLTSDQLYQVFSKKSLCVESEDHLFDFIFEKARNDQSFCQLFEFIEFANLSCDRIMKFTSEISLENINYGIWKSLCRKLQNETSGKKRKYKGEGYESLINLPYSSSNEMKGIISHLSSKFHCNVGQINIVKVTASSVYQPLKVFSPYNAVELLTTSSFKSKNEENQWICFDFKDRRIIPSYYSIKSSNNVTNSCSPKSWVVESSEDGYNWKEIDRQINCNIFDTYYEFANNVASFPIKSASYHEKVRFLRIRQIEKNTANNNYLCIQGVEFYGKLIDKAESTSPKALSKSANLNMYLKDQSSQLENSNNSSNFFE